jgi:hypothetical protein
MVGGFGRERSAYLIAKVLINRTAAAFALGDPAERAISLKVRPPPKAACPRGSKPTNVSARRRANGQNQ